MTSNTNTIIHQINLNYSINSGLVKIKTTIITQWGSEYWAISDGCKSAVRNMVATINWIKNSKKPNHHSLKCLFKSTKRTIK